MARTTTPVTIRETADLGRLIRRLRRRDGLTLAEAAGLCGVGIRFLSELENGKPTVRCDRVWRVLRGFGLTLQVDVPGEVDPSGEGEVR